MKIVTPAEQLMYSTVRLESDYLTGHGSGTAFMYSHQIGDANYLFLVSNKHVVLDARGGRFFFTVADGDEPRIGEKITVGFDDFGVAWFGHPDPDLDIAVMPIAPLITQLKNDGKAIYTRAIPSDITATRQTLEGLDSLEQVVFVGYPSGMYDSHNLTPITRVGVTATHPGLDYCGKKAFLIDASVFPGSSGSPVLILSAGSYAIKGGGIAIGSRILFLGILSGVFTRREQGDIEIKKIPIARAGISFIDQMIDLGYVFKAELVHETAIACLRERGIKVE